MDSTIQCTQTTSTYGVTSTGQTTTTATTSTTLIATTSEITANNTLLTEHLQKGLDVILNVKAEGFTQNHVLKKEMIKDSTGQLTAIRLTYDKNADGFNVALPPQLYKGDEPGYTISDQTIEFKPRYVERLPYKETIDLFNEKNPPSLLSADQLQGLDNFRQILSQLLKETKLPQPLSEKPIYFEQRQTNFDRQTNSSSGPVKSVMAKVSLETLNLRHFLRHFLDPETVISSLKARLGEKVVITDSGEAVTPNTAYIELYPNNLAEIKLVTPKDKQASETEIKQTNQSNSSLQAKDNPAATTQAMTRAAFLRSIDTDLVAHNLRHLKIENGKVTFANLDPAIEAFTESEKAGLMQFVSHWEKIAEWFPGYSNDETRRGLYLLLFGKNTHEKFQGFALLQKKAKEDSKQNFTITKTDGGRNLVLSIHKNESTVFSGTVQNSVATLFYPAVEPYGYRRDLTLLDLVSESFTDTPIPKDKASFEQTLRAKFEHFLQEMEKDPGNEKFNRGGMSEGETSNYWKEKAIPKIVEHFEKRASQASQ